MEFKYELLKIKAENTRTWVVCILALSVSLLIGSNAITNSILKSSFEFGALGISLIALLLFVIYQHRYSEVRNYLERKIK